jgi:hypothetical protein
MADRLVHEMRFEVVAISQPRYNFNMSTLSEIEAAVDALPPADKQELLLFIAARLREQAGNLPPPRRFSGEQLRAWITEDEAEMQRFRDGKPE